MVLIQMLQPDILLFAFLDHREDTKKGSNILNYFFSHLSFSALSSTLYMYSLWKKSHQAKHWYIIFSQILWFCDNEFTHYFPSAGRCSATSRKSAVSWEDRKHHSKLHSSVLNTGFVAGHNVIWYGISLWPVWVSCRGCVSSHLLVHPWQGSSRSESLWLTVSTAL